ncbi:MAG: hypothetical protein JWQ66_4496 [Mucilaginibacter sp.]|nr:hypothetical protein [Mucilaginibacter sp.]
MHTGSQKNNPYNNYCDVKLQDPDAGIDLI